MKFLNNSKMCNKANVNLMYRMSNKLFCKKIDIQLLRSFFDKISYEKHGSYTIDYNAYKKMIFHDLYPIFCDFVKSHYYKSKHFYIDRELTYNTFTTIIRQICNYNCIIYTSTIRYVESIYHNEYTIFMEDIPHKNIQS